MSLSTFLNPIDGTVEVQESTLEYVIAAHIVLQLEEDEDEEVAEPPSTINQELNGLKRLLSFKNHEPDANSVKLTILMCMEISLLQLVEYKRRQWKLDSWFKWSI
ncbi:BgTH12-07131 [Blumeria graminis f. sp. triticale]|uniref:BgTH12-07131 n=1 Tax=Blumeria graminis f. sp. triticale TaxID=1689686 RepID=A0A9W4DQN4_BLUGR|nr:BgTH12-07131 [Blumeria graminis f. sp. triticale]